MSSSVCRRLHGLFTRTPKSTAAVLIPSQPDSSDSLSLKDKRLKILVTKFKKATDSDRFRNSHRSYANTVNRLLAAQKFSDIEDILEHQKKYDDITREGFTVRLICLYGKSGMFDQARKLFDEMPQLNCKRTVLSFNALLSACVNSKKYDQIGELFSELPEKLSIKPDLVSFNTVIKAFCEMGSFDSAFSLIDGMEKNALEPDLITFNTLLDAFYRNGRFSDAEKVWELMEQKNVVPSVRSYNPKLRALVVDNKISEAVELIEEMRSKGVKPDVYSFNALIKGMCDDGNMEAAKMWYEELKTHGCNPNRVTFSLLGRVASDQGDFDFALKLCREAITQRCLLNTNMMQLVVEGLVKESKMEDARELVELGKSNNYCHYKLVLTSEE